MKLAILLFTLFLSSCVTQSEHDKIVSEKDIVFQERDALKQELEDIKFGAPNLLAEGKRFYDAKNFTEARIKFQTLVDRHPNMSQSLEARKYLAEIDEEELWSLASKSDNIANTDNYISKYPKGKYITNAIEWKKWVKVLNIKKAYEFAESRNSSTAWTSFLIEYPDHKDAKAIRKKIIRLEVDEIAGNSETGQMPSFSRNSSGYSASSSVQIRNDTRCELTVRYSGPDAEIIVIPVGGTRRINLTSGDYKIAASACGSDYAGTESLSGNYSSSFYISTRSY